jgi:hypothetical protein
MSAWKEYKTKLGETRPWDMLNPNAPQSSDEESESRYNTCLDCDRLLPVTHQCKECGCFMKMKVKLQNATCPLGKW